MRLSGRIFFIISIPDRLPGSNSSGPAVPDRHLSFFNDDGDVPSPIREFQHFLELCLVLLHIMILGAAVSRPGPVRIGSTGLPVDNDIACHDYLRLLFLPVTDPVYSPCMVIRYKQ